MKRTIAAILCICAFSSPALPQQWPVPPTPSIYPQCEDGVSRYGICRLVAQNWGPVPECARPFSGSVAMSYEMLCRDGGCVYGAIADTDAEAAVKACLQR